MSAAAWCRRAAAVSGASSIASAAYGAHGLKVEGQLKATYEHAVRYHQLGSIMLCVASKMPRPLLTGGLFGIGTLGFSGSCYAAALTGDRANGRLAPFGGGALILAWLTLLL